MKILICTDGSESSQKALEEAKVIAQGCNVVEAAVIHVHDPALDTTFPHYESITAEQMQNYQNMLEGQKREREKLLTKASGFLEKNNIKARTILKEGHPSSVIVKVAKEEGFDMIVIGSRGIGGLKKFLLGSVSNAVVQEAEGCSVLVVK
ncbi:MAG: universal stress protein [Atribacterota bacterium]|nr:universal stress protein [Atribacterota bacterium]